MRSIARRCMLLPGLTAIIGVAAAQGPDSLPIAAALLQPSFPPYMPVSVSPDGHKVAYTICSPDGADRDSLIGGYSPTGAMPLARGCSVWVASVDGAKSVRVGDAHGTSEWAPQWSPDGHKVAFYSDEGGTARLWVCDAAATSAHAVSDAIVRPYTFLEGPRWTPDSRGVITRILPYGTTLDSTVTGPPPIGVSWDTAGRAPGSTVMIYHTDPTWRLQTRQIPSTVSTTETFYEGDLALISITTGEVKTLAHGYKPFAYWVSPGGRFIAFTSLHGITNGTTSVAAYRLDLLVADMESKDGGLPRLIADQATISPFGTGVAWSPAGGTFVYATIDPDGTESYHEVRTADWHVRLFRETDAIRRALAGRSGAQPLRWDATGQTMFVAADSLVAQVHVGDGVMYPLSRPPRGTSIVGFVGPATRGTAWVAAGSSLVVETRNDSTKRMGFAKIAVRRGTWTQVVEESQYLGAKTFSSTDVSANGRRIVFVSESSTRPPDLWTATSKLSDARRITMIAPTLSGRPYGETRLIQWRTASGQQTNGALLLPVGYERGHRYPLIVYPYPLAHRSNNVFQFGLEGLGTENMQIFATRGFAVLAPDAPIRVADQMRSLADVILPGVEQVVEMGIADSARLGVIGHSWGGYAVLALLVQTPRFRAAVMRGGYGDLFASYGEMQPTGATVGQLLLESFFGATPWRDLPRYIDNSPVFVLDRVRTPLLIVEGGAETTVPPHEAAEIFVDLRRLGQEVEYALYAGEDHGEIAWRLANQQDYLARVIQWFDRHLVDAGAVKDGGDTNRVSGDLRRRY